MTWFVFALVYVCVIISAIRLARLFWWSRSGRDSVSEHRRFLVALGRAVHDGNDAPCDNPECPVCSGD